MSNTPRNTNTRDRHRAAIARAKPPCHICLGEIDYALPHTDPMSYVVDHIIPLTRGGTDEIENKQSAHRTCNRTKGASLPEDSRPRTYVTHRTW